jgi:hypothetical protein
MGNEGEERGEDVQIHITMFFGNMKLLSTMPKKFRRDIT